LQVLGFAWLASSTLEDALDRWVRYHRVASTAVVMERGDEDGTAIYSLTPAAGFGGQSIVLGEAGLAALVALCRRASTDGFTPVWVSLTRADPGQRSRYEDWFRAPIAFEAGANAMALRHEDIRRRLPAGNEDLAAEADRWLARMLAQVDQGQTTVRVRELLSQLLSSGGTTADEVARRLNRSVSSLQRDLRREGTTFRAVIEETRQTLARRLLREEGRSIG
jgi:AraC-like DNA-binding protein